MNAHEHRTNDHLFVVVAVLGSVYNIPVCIWLLDNHPFSPPMVYVKPTPDMLIKASRHVDQNGKVFLPYLHEWNLVGGGSGYLLLYFSLSLTLSFSFSLSLSFFLI